MIAATAMLFVAQAVTPCTTAGLPRLAGGAVLVRPVTQAEPMPFLPLGPAISIRNDKPAIQQVGAPAADPAAEDPAKQCEAVISIA